MKDSVVKKNGIALFVLFLVLVMLVTTISTSYATSSAHVDAKVDKYQFKTISDDTLDYTYEENGQKYHAIEKISGKSDNATVESKIYLVAQGKEVPYSTVEKKRTKLCNVRDRFNFKYCRRTVK